MITNKLLRLAKALLSLSQTTTDKGTLIAESELAVGVEVFIEDENGEMVNPENGEYETETQIIVVEDGKVTEIKEKEEKKEDEPKPEETTEETVELSAQEQFKNKCVEKFATYQEIEHNIYKAFEENGKYVYLMENTDDYVIVEEWVEDGCKYFKYGISIDENGAVTVDMNGVEVKTVWVAVEEEIVEPTEPEVDEEKEELKSQIAELKSQIAAKDELLSKSVAKLAKEEKKEPKQTKSIYNFKRG